MVTILSFLLTPLGRWAAGAGGVLLLVVAFGSHQRSVGAQKAVAKIEKATNDAIGKAATAGDKSRAGRGMLNPYYRD